MRVVSEAGDAAFMREQLSGAAQEFLTRRRKCQTRAAIPSSKSSISEGATMRNLPVVRAALVLLLVLAGVRLVASTPSAASSRVPALKVLRVADRALSDLIDLGISRSPTLRFLESRLEDDQVIAYVVWGAKLPSGTAARTRLIGAGGGYRYLSIELDIRLARLNVLAMLGHELQHAAEIGDAPEVVDDKSMAILYHRIGIEQRDSTIEGLWFETWAAIEAGHRVYNELVPLG
jgi:hypothetical protein